MTPAEVADLGASCSFPEGEFTCVDDAVEMWWDPLADPPFSDQPGCMRMVRDGARTPPGLWASADEVFENPEDPCTALGRTYRIRPG